MSDELKIKKERVLEVAEECAQTKRILKTLFPGAFKFKEFDLTKLKIDRTASMKNYDNIFEDTVAAGFDKRLVFRVCAAGKYKDRGILLDENYNWHIVCDALYGRKALVPSRRESIPDKDFHLDAR